MAARKGKATGTAVAAWDEELAAQAKIAADMEEGAGGAQFFSLKSGVLSFGGAPMPNNEAAVVICDSILENVFFEGEFDPDTPQAPTCYAFGRVEKELEPHRMVVEAGNHQHDSCGGCPMNEWGTADKGRGKACRNVRRLALLPAGHFDDKGDFVPIEDEEYLANAAFGFAKVPVTSVKGYANFVKQTANVLNVPPHGIYTRMKLVPDQKDQFHLVFTPLGKIPKELMGIVMRRNKEAQAVIETPYPPIGDAEAAPRGGGRAKRNQRPPVRKGGAAKKAAPARAAAGARRGR